MNIVEIVNGAVVTTIHGTKEKLKSGKVTKGLNSIDSFVFSMYPNNAGFDLINEFTTHVTVYNARKNRYDFIGRVLYAETTMDEGGMIVKTVTCESLLGYLCDSVQAYVEEKNWTVSGLLNHLINCHNSQVEEYKQFKIGNITQTEENDNIFAGIQREDTWNALKTKMVEKIGGEFKFRLTEDGLYIDYLDRIGVQKETEIALSVNMKSITREQDPTAYVTRLIPLGCKLKDAEGNETEQRLDITSVNGGVNYIDDEAAIAVYGIHVKVVEWDDIETPSKLLSTSKKWMGETNRIKVKYTVSALDLSPLGLAVDDFDIGNTHPVKNYLIGVDDTARIVKVNIDVCDEFKSTFEIGDNIKRLSDLQWEQMQDATNKVMQSLQTSIKNQKNEIDKELASLKTTSTEQYTAAVQTSEAIMFEALKRYVETSAYEEFKQELSTQLSIWADGIRGSVTATERYIEQVDGDLQEKFNTITKYFTFDINGLTIGQVNNPNKVIIDNDEISILVENQVVQTFKSTGEGLIPMLVISKSLNLLGLEITEDNDRINCEYIDYVGGV